MAVSAVRSVKQKLVVLGTGWAGFSFLRSIDSALYDVTVLSVRDHMVFTPLLCSTAVGTLEHRSIMEPVRPLAAHKNMNFMLAEAMDINVDKKSITAQPLVQSPIGPKSESFEVSYDKLVVAVGALPNTFGIPGVIEHALFMKEAQDGRAVRARIHACFEAAMYPGVSVQEKKNLLTFVVVGGGPIGVEFSSELSDYILEDVSVDYPSVAPLASVVLLEASGNVLSMFDTDLRDYGLRRLRAQRVAVRLGAAVQAVERSRVRLSTGEQLPCGMVLWATGVGSRPLLGRLRTADGPLALRAGRLPVDNQLRVAGCHDVYALGDCAGLENALPAVAQVAEQQGQWLAHQLAVPNSQSPALAPVPAPAPQPAGTASTSTNSAPASALSDQTAAGAPAFEFHSRGMMAYVGGWRALAKLGGSRSVNVKGLAAFAVWRGGYLTKLGSWRNRLQVPFDWVKTYLFGRDISNF